MTPTPSLKKPMNTIVSRRRIIKACCDLGQDIRAHYGDKPFTALWIASGAMIFAAWLIQQIKSSEVRERSLLAKSYDRTMSTGTVIITPDRVDIESLRNRRVLIIDDILDTGRTLTTVKEYVESKGAAEIKTCVLLQKPHECRMVPIIPDFVGIDIPNVFVVGFGLDYRDRFRDLRYVAELDKKTKAQVDFMEDKFMN